MGVLIFILAFLGASWGTALTRSLRLWSRRVQTVGGLVIVLVGGALIYASTNPGLFDRFILD
ncbi:MAG: hypothetical protein V3V35_07035 [Dehalococcoidia bacterium]